MAVQFGARRLRERYAVVSCHVERPLDDAVWALFSALQRRRPGGFRDRGSHSSGRRRVRGGRVRLARAGRARPLQTGRSDTTRTGRRPTTLGPRAVRPVSASSPRARGSVSSGSRRGCSAEAAGMPTSRSRRRVRSSGTSTARHAPARPPYLPPGERWASLTALRSSSCRRDGRWARFRRRTRSATSLAPSRRRVLPDLVHVYFHDTDLLDRRRRALLGLLLRLLARRARVSDLDALAARTLPAAPHVVWDDVARL